MNHISSVPKFHTPSVFGVRPSNNFFFALPVEGQNISIRCLNPPSGTSFEPGNGSLSGKIADPGIYRIRFEAENTAGHASCTVKFIVGESLQLTPPMGWNSWYCFSEGVSDSRIRETALALVERGLSSHGWKYVNIDDCWQGKRGGRWNAIQGNERFPDMLALADYIHSLGLRFGIYSTPWISTYAGFRGGSSDNGAEEALSLHIADRLQPCQVFGRYPALIQRGLDRVGSTWLFDSDIHQWAEWGVDWVKADWYPNDLPATRKIADGLRQCGRDITLSLSNNAPVEDAAELLANAQLCRISGDIRDEWESIVSIGFDHPADWYQVMGPGRFPDPDMLQIGSIGIPNSPNPTYTPTRLSPVEQRTQFSLWCLLSAPLLLSCDIAGMDDATMELLSNDELIAIDQDPLVAPPRIEDVGNGILIYRKAMVDGTEAVGIFNRSDSTHSCRLEMETHGCELWTKEELELNGEFQVEPHASLIFRTV